MQDKPLMRTFTRNPRTKLGSFPENFKPGMNLAF
jgi:hypothetical protein